MTLHKNNSADEKVAKIIADGASALHIISDFDDTITRAYIKGEKTPSSFGQLRNKGFLGEEYVKQSQALYDTYAPIEKDSQLTPEQKSPKMIEWWNLHKDLMVEKGVTKEVFEKIADAGHLHLRDYFLDIAAQLHTKKIPLLIFSAGLGNVIEAFFEKMNLLTDNVHIISNNYSFDDEGKPLGYAHEPIHPFNKCEVVMESYSYHSEIEARKNVILLGDVIADCGMADGMKHDCVLKIGFLNKPDYTTKEFDEYLANFDIVLTGDDSFEILHEIVAKI